MENTIYIGSDHAGFEYKEKLINYLNSKGYNCINMGTDSTESVDYPLIAKPLCDAVLKSNSVGILVCGTGIGMSIASNRIKGIRATVCWNVETAKLSREHNNSNVLCLGARMLDFELVKTIVDIYLNTDFAGGKHERRLNEIENY